MKNSIYFDFNATTPCDPEVVEAMLPYFSETFGNASSQHHAFGWLASDALEKSAHSIAQGLGVSPNELVFTSGATESINAIIKGVYAHSKGKKNHIITVKTEHKAVLDVCNYLEQSGARVTYLDVDQNGLIDLDALEEAITAQTLLVAVMWANNETGVLQPLAKISTLCKKHHVLFFSDATQALGKIPLDDFFSLVDFACFSAHKIYGPKGMGLMFIKSTVAQELGSFIQGGGQQRKLRGGTYNIPGIVGMAKAMEINLIKVDENTENYLPLREALEKGLAQIEGTTINAFDVERLPNTVNISFSHVDGEQLLNALSPYLAVSNGSACNSASVFPSHVLTAMGVATTLAFSSLRISMGKYTTEEGVRFAVEKIAASVTQLREKNVLWSQR